MKVSFRPSVQENAELMAVVQREQQSGISQEVSWIYFVFNIGVVPAWLILYEMYLFALVVFLGNALLGVFLLARQQNRNMREYVERVSPDLEKYDCEIEIDDRGVSCDRAGNHLFFAWRNIFSIRQTGELIFFDAGAMKILVPKRAFTESHPDVFISEANRLKGLRPVS